MTDFWFGNRFVPDQYAVKIGRLPALTPGVVLAGSP
jgi:hypothetical protein